MPGRVPRTAFGRRRANQQFDRECDIRRASDSGPVAVATLLPCSLIPAVDENQRIDSEVVGAGGWVVIVPYGTDIRSADRVVIGAQTFMVARVLAPESHAAATRALCMET